jgi:hypothetical protein
MTDKAAGPAFIVICSPSSGHLTSNAPLSRSGEILMLTIPAASSRRSDQFKVVKPGDHVEVTYAKAIAVAVEPNK